MSYVVVRMAKMKSHDLKGIQFHNQRERESRTNPDIDKERSKENYDLVNEENINYNERVKEIIESQKTGTRKTRKDAVLVNELLVTSDREFFDGLKPEEQKRFFEESLKYFSERYGSQNIAYSTVHNDEKTPHMHLGVVPMREGRLQGKNVFNRNELLFLQEELPKHMREKGFDLERGEKGSKAKHLDTMRYKLEQTKIQKNELEQEIEEKKEGLTKEFEEFAQKEKENIAADLKKFKEPKDIFDKIDENAEKKTVGVVNKKDVVILQKKDYERLGVLAKSSIRSNYQFENYKSDAKKEIGELQKIKKELEGKNEKLEKQLERLEEHKKNEVIFKSMLQDENRDLNISQTEIDGRLILFNLEHGDEPKNREEGEKWVSVLEENKRLKTIPQSRLQWGLERLKVFIEKLLGRNFSMNSVLHKDRQEKLKKQNSKKKSHNVEL